MLAKPPAGSVLLYIRCPGKGCPDEPSYWYHVKCSTRVYVDAECDIYCTGTEVGCQNPSTRFMMNWCFKCDNVEAHKGEYFRFDEETLSFALSSVISMVKYIKGLSAEDKKALRSIYYKMQVKLMEKVGKELTEDTDPDNALES